MQVVIAFSCLCSATSASSAFQIFPDCGAIAPRGPLDTLSNSMSSARREYDNFTAMGIWFVKNGSSLNEERPQGAVQRLDQILKSPQFDLNLAWPLIRRFQVSAPKPVHQILATRVDQLLQADERTGLEVPVLAQFAWQ